MHGANAAPSNAQVNVLPGLLELNVNLAEVMFVGSCGSVARSIVTTGLMRSIIQVYEVIAPSLPAGSRALTSKTCCPAESPV